ncbi:MAG: hypothetical protein HYZ81_14615 [Nitrospinae bacterium]|nr:hypothetical protein [Nitrospinota bacterium]
MPKSFPAARYSQFQGQILLERALFCVGCEIIFTGSTCCPRCRRVETFWPLADWLRSTRSSAMVSAPQLGPRADESPAPHQQRMPSAG